MPASPVLRIELFGGFHLLTDDRPAPRVPSARQQQVIAYLILHARTAPVQRQRVAASLWPESTDAQALTNLRRELHHLRESFPKLDALIDAESRTLGWRADARVIVDVVTFETAADRGLAGGLDRTALQEAARLYKGDLLPDCSGEWIDPERDRLRERATHVLTRLVASLEHDRDFGEAIERVQQLLRLDPLDEAGLVRAHALSRAARRACDGAAHLSTVRGAAEERARRAAKRADAHDLPRDPRPR